LLVLGGTLADHPDHAAALDDPAVLTDGLDAGANLQDLLLNPVRDKT
jgi:hypothetical protein